MSRIPIALVAAALLAACSTAPPAAAPAAGPATVSAPAAPSDPLSQLAAFTLTDLVMDRTKREQFITHYNGPANIDAYWQRMQAAITALGGPVVVGEGVST